MIQMMVVDEVFQIFGVEILGSQYRSLWYTEVDCARARLLIFDLIGLCSARLLRYDSNHFRAVSFTQNRSCSPCNMIGWYKVSNAALRSSSTIEHTIYHCLSFSQYCCEIWNNCFCRVEWTVCRWMMRQEPVQFCMLDEPAWSRRPFRLS